MKRTALQAIERFVLGRRMLEALKVRYCGGITEWLPISSTGHLILLEELLHLKQNQAAFLDMFLCCDPAWSDTGGCRYVFP